MPGPLSLHGDGERLDSSRSSANSTRPAPGVARHVSRQLRHGGRDARLVLCVEPERVGDLPRALARQDDVFVTRDLDGQQTRHATPPFLTTTTLASSRGRAMIAKEHGGNDVGAPRRQAIAGRQRPVGADAVAVHDEEAAAWPLVGEVLHPPHDVTGNARKADEMTAAAPSRLDDDGR